MQISSLYGWLEYRTVDLYWGEWLISSAHLNPNHNHVNAAQNQTSLQSPDHFTSTQPCNPPANLLFVKCTRLYTNLLNKKLK